MVNINIPLPTSCASCPLSVRHFGKLYCPPLDGRVGNEGKDSRCPLVDAEGRGDLISRQDALSCFHDWIDRHGDVHTADEMPEYQRIEQLPSAQPEERTENTRGTHARDLISRQWLMECIDEGWIKFDTEKDANTYIHLVRDIAPSAQPEILACGEGELISNPDVPDTNAGDLISRQAAIDSLGERPPVWTGSDYELGQRNQYDLDRLHLELVPSAQPKTGKWIDKSGGIEGAWNYCSVCGEQAIDLYDFCPNCGAMMLKEGE